MCEGRTKKQHQEQSERRVRASERPREYELKATKKNMGRKVVKKKRDANTKAAKANTYL